MKVLLITANPEDYLQDSIIHGFKELLKTDAVEYPIKQCLYGDYTRISDIRGGGMSLYGLLDKNIKVTITNMKKSVKDDFFDMIVFTSIYRQKDIFRDMFDIIRNCKAKVICMDGEDCPIIFPYNLRRNFAFRNYPKPHKYFDYYKREITEQTIQSFCLRFLPQKTCDLIFNMPEKIKPIAFSIPEEKIVTFLPQKEKLFGKHIVDEEIATYIKESYTTYAFQDENEYYRDLQISKYGITTKRAGWDCLRHYEIAANGTVICFKDLDKKPKRCAPHGLIDGVNCVNYHSYMDLMKKIDSISDDRYVSLQQESIKWIRNNTTKERVKQLIQYI